MALHYTRRKDETDEKTLNVSEFIDRMMELKLQPKQMRQEPRTESPK